MTQADARRALADGTAHMALLRDTSANDEFHAIPLYRETPVVVAPRGSEIAEIGYSVPDDVLSAVDRAESMVFDVAQRRVTDSMSPIKELLDASLTRLEMLYEKGDSITGLPTGYHGLDELLSGLQPSTLVIVGARPATGKCLTGDTPMVDPRTGARTTLAELYDRGRRGGEVAVATIGDDQQLGAHESGGRRSAQGRAASSCAASDSSVSSPSGRATICTAIGRRSALSPDGSEIAGLPRWFQIALKGTYELTPLNVRSAPWPVHLPTGGGS